MPADPGAGGIFIDEGLNERPFIQIEPSGQTIQQRRQEIRPGFGRVQSTSFKVVAASESRDPSEALIAHVLIGPEAQILQVSDHHRLLCRREDVRPIVEACRRGKPRDVAEQIGLEHGRHSASSFGAAPDGFLGEALSRLDRVTPTSRTPRLGG